MMFFNQSSNKVIRKYDEIQHWHHSGVWQLSNGLRFWLCHSWPSRYLKALSKSRKQKTENRKQKTEGMYFYFCGPVPFMQYVAKQLLDMVGYGN
ncbi:hypothetical protein ABLB90_04805 [Photorhabdus bodei]